MVYRIFLLVLAFSQVSFSSTFLGGSRDKLHGPTVVLDQGIFVGTSEGDVSIFRGIPYALPPVRDLRFRPPVANVPYKGTYNATAFGAACIQQRPNDANTTGLNPIAAGVLQEFVSNWAPQVVDDEDCLTINVYAPANATWLSKLPIVYWIYGGGFQNGASSNYNGTAIVERSLQLNEPVIYVSVNYRLSALGFAGSAEVRAAGNGNLGLHDQRLGLRWVQKYVRAFGGDPSKVTIWGESAGSISVAMQMIANKGDSEGLFRGAFMQSGGPVSLGTGTLEEGQPFFNDFAADAGCANYLGSVAVFDCLRKASVIDIRTAIAASRNVFDYASLALAWQPLADGKFLTADAQRLVLDGSVADIPFVIGDNDDEGTIFSLSNSNITTDDEVRQYLQQYYFATVNASMLDSILSAYPSDPTLGSPFDTGLNNSITPEYKRLAAILGDFVFQAPRRLLLTKRSGNANAYSFLNKRGKETPVIGTYHGSDLSIFEPGDLMDVLINFVTKLDPNGATLINWPKYTPDAPALFTLVDGNVTQEITNDTYRAEGMEAILHATIAGTY